LFNIKHIYIYFSVLTYETKPAQLDVTVCCLVSINMSDSGDNSTWSNGGMMVGHGKLTKPAPVPCPASTTSLT